MKKAEKPIKHREHTSKHTNKYGGKEWLPIIIGIKVDKSRTLIYT